jgi:PAS domain S-box-containing protein
MRGKARKRSNKLFKGKLTEIPKKESLVLYKTLVDKVLTGIGIGQGGKMILYNRKFAELFGYDERELLYCPIMDLVAPESRKKVKNYTTKNEKGEKVPEYFEFKGLRKDGKKIDLEVRISCINYKGKPATVANFNDITERKAMEKDLKNLSAALIAVQEKQRKLFAQEIHDVIGQQLTAVKIDMEFAEKECKEDSVSKKKLREIKSRLLKIMEDTRRICYDLRPPLLEELGIENAIKWYITEFQRRSGLSIKLKMENIKNPLPEKIAISIFRIIQESLMNIWKHAKAKNILVNIKGSKKKINIMVKDDGCGFNTKGEIAKFVKSRHLGILGIKERVTQLNGSFLINSTLKKGSTLLIEIPL